MSVFSKNTFQKVKPEAFNTSNKKAILDKEGARSLITLVTSSHNVIEAFCIWLSKYSDLKTKKNKRLCLRVELSKMISLLDEILSEAISNILHHEDFQALESAWTGLFYLAVQKHQKDIEGRIKIKVIDLSWAELSKDVHKAIEFDQSEFFKMIYSQEFDMPGGEPYGVIIANYQLSHTPRKNIPYNDLDTLKLISQTAAASFSPFIASVKPSLLGLNDFTDLGRPINISEHFMQSDFVKWRSLRSSDDVRYIGLTLPEILMRRPYRQYYFNNKNKFQFSELIRHPKDDYLWGNAAFAFGSVLIRAFTNHGWFAQIRGATRGQFDGGIVESLPFEYLKVSRNIREITASVNVKIGDKTEHELSHNGFISLCHLKNSSHHVFYSNNSIQEPRDYNKQIANVNARISSMLQYILSASRFAHYLKIICRNRVGRFDSSNECQLYLQNWLHEYTTASDSDSIDLKARYPLKEASVSVEDVPGRPGMYSCIAHLQPHFQMDQMVSSLKLVTELPAKA
ncbi:type VI secretion system contractile sheath large subunit [Aliikangiella maris]|uniref:Type VI secretion system contractile sheath large subunit n=2 Tax=Aliikangiella maris TaxID=3162458 RepID=A0ABV3MNB5_9GAMM